MTLQNVLLIGRLGHEMEAAYRKYLQWLKTTCDTTATFRGQHKVYLTNAGGAIPPIGILVEDKNMFLLVRQGLLPDVKRVRRFIEQFRMRQHSRHLIGHESCPDSQGQCWKETGLLNPDASDICPQSESANTLIPCFRIVEEMKRKVETLLDDLGS